MSSHRRAHPTAGVAWIALIASTISIAEGGCLPPREVPLGAPMALAEGEGLLVIHTSSPWPNRTIGFGVGRSVPDTEEGKRIRLLSAAAPRPPPEARRTAAAGPSPVVARVGGDVIRADDALRLRLHDLDARYRLRRAHLERLVAARLVPGASDCGEAAPD